MLGHRVYVCLTSPDEIVSGELRKQDESGVWIYHGFAEQARVHFYPMHRVTSMEDHGYVSR